MNNKDLKKIMLFVEELSWVFKTHKNLDINELLLELQNSQKIRNELIHTSTVKTDNKHRLIGILPSLLNDKKLFSKNSDLIEFAESTFKIEISRPEKRSRYEIIGLVIMELYKTENDEILEITDSIQQLTSNTNLKTILKNKKMNSNFSWNLAIREITNK